MSKQRPSLPPELGPSADTRKIGVIALVPDNWHGIWMPRHHVVGRLARHFEVVWIEPAKGWRDYWLANDADEPEVQSTPAADYGLTLYHPGRWLPELYRPRWLADRIRKQRVIRAERILRRRGCSKIVLYLWRPEFDWALDAIQADLSCYHIDDEYQFSVNDLPNDPREVALIRRVDQVIIHSRKLLEKKGTLNSQTIHVPNGVDYAAYAMPQPQPQPQPADIAHLPRPRLGYVGVIKSQLDLDLLHRLARQRPEWSFVMVGPEGFVGGKENLLAALKALPNVHFTGNRQLADLPAYMQAMDVCLMCYEVCDYTHFIYPLKLNEYLATGRPVVCSPIDSVLPLGHMVGIADDLAAWNQALEHALSAEANTPQAQAARRQQASQHDWDSLVEQIAGQFRQRLAQKETSHGTA